MDITESLAPTSDQLDAIELVSGPRTFVVESVSAGTAEQPVQVKLVDFPRVWRPSKGMRRVLAAGWGVDASKWAGRSVTLFFDPDVSFGKDKPGGTRISHMSDLPGGERLSVPLLVSRGKSAMFTVDPLTEPARSATTSEPTAKQLAAAADLDQLKEWWRAHPKRRQQIEARVAELTETEQPEESDEDKALLGAHDAEQDAEQDAADDDARGEAG
jgi:hypothetical protein